MNENPLSVTQLLLNLNEGDSLAAQQIWSQFIERLIRLANKRLKQLPRRAFDEEDVAVSAFNAFLAGVEDKRFRELHDRNDLWQVLAMLTERKAIGMMRREMAEKRGGAMNRGESVFEQLLVENSVGAGIEGVADPSPQMLDSFTNEVREMLDSLSQDAERKVAMLKLQGFSNQEIADELGTSLRSVERKLSLIRQQWQHLADQEVAD